MNAGEDGSAMQAGPEDGIAELVPLSEQHVGTLMTWFPDSDSVAIWSPDNSFPFVRDRFIAEAMLTRIPSFMLLDHSAAPVAFGQYYARHGCCHLARLVVAPQRRGEGFGRRLIERLCERGMTGLSTNRCSLFVLAHNATALRLYQRLGFTETLYPEKLPVPDCLYMTRTAGA